MTPPMPGPTMRAALNTEEFSATALCMSSRGTRSLTKAWRAGVSKVVNRPNKSASTYTCQSCTCPVSVTKASANACNVSSVLVIMISRRLPTRSATTPATSDSSMAGMNWKMVRRPSAAGELARSSTSQACAMRCSQVPLCETT